MPRPRPLSPPEATPELGDEPLDASSCGVEYDSCDGNGGTPDLVAEGYSMASWLDSSGDIGVAQLMEALCQKITEVESAHKDLAVK